MPPFTLLSATFSRPYAMVFLTALTGTKNALPTMFLTCVRGLPSIARYLKLLSFSYHVASICCATLCSIFAHAVFMPSSSPLLSALPYSSYSTLSTCISALLSLYFSLRSSSIVSTDFAARYSLHSGESLLSMRIACKDCAVFVEFFTISEAISSAVA